MQFPPMKRTPLPDVDTLLNDAEFTGNYYLNSIVYKIGAAGVHAKERTDERTIGNTWLFIIAVSFAKTTLVRSTVHGTKDFDPLDPTRISAITNSFKDVRAKIFQH